MLHLLIIECKAEKLEEVFYLIREAAKKVFFSAADMGDRIIKIYS